MAGTATSPARASILQPIAAPSVLGLFGFAGATFIVAANMAGWYGSAVDARATSSRSPRSSAASRSSSPACGRIAPATPSRRRCTACGARSGSRTACCSCSLATGVLQTGGTLDHALGFWFIALCAITFSGMLGALAEGNLGVTAVLGTLAAGAGRRCGCVPRATAPAIEHVAGWVFVIAAILAWYVATGMMLKGAAGQDRAAALQDRHGGEQAGRHADARRRARVGRARHQEGPVARSARRPRP